MDCRPYKPISNDDAIKNADDKEKLFVGVIRLATVAAIRTAGRFDEDLQSIALMYAWRAVCRWDPAKGTLKTYVYTAVKRALWDHFEKDKLKTKNPPLKLLESLDHISKESNVTGCIKDLEEYIKHIKNPQTKSDFCRLYGLLGEEPTSMPQLAKEQGVPRQYVYSRIQTAIGQMANAYNVLQLPSGNSVSRTTG